jgi:hypothetical protein
MSRSLLGVILVASASVGKVSKVENQRIADFQFSAARLVDARDLAKAEPLKKSDLPKTDDITSAIDGLFATGCFAAMHYRVAKHDLPIYRVHMIGLRKDRPLSYSNTREACAKNRSVELKVFSADQVTALVSGGTE